MGTSSLLINSHPFQLSLTNAMYHSNLPTVYNVHKFCTQPCPFVLLSETLLFFGCEAKEITFINVFLLS